MTKKQRLKNKQRKEQGMVPIHTKDSIRVPRPQGYTMALNHLKQRKDTKRLNYLKHLLIEQWTINNYELNGTRYTTQQLSYYLNLPIPLIMRAMNNAMVRLANFFGKDEEEIKQFTRAQIFLALKNCTESHIKASQQLELLTVSQDGKYRPFISQTVNSAIKNLIDSHKPILDAIKILSDKTPGILIQDLRSTTNSQTNTYITTEKAVAIIEAKIPNLIDNGPLILSLPEMQDQGIPNISAVTQDLSSIGIKKAKITSITKVDKIKDGQYDHGKRDKMGQLIELSDKEVGDLKA